jgi:DNA polymerase-3 subunit alpha
MDECKAMGIQVLGPDVNESMLKFSVNDKGNIRFGLAAIKGVGEAAVSNIIEVRKKGGAFKDIFDFVERVNLNACNRKCMESLALGGAFDNLSIQREQFFADAGKGEAFMELLLRYGSKYQADKTAALNSLFGDDSFAIISKPIIPQCESWSDLERLDKEKELVGIYLSAHPLDEYRTILEYVCNTRAIELADLESLQNRDILIGGIVTNVREGMGKTGKPFGIMKLEDFSGTGEIALFGNDYVNFGKYFRKGIYLLIKARVEPNRWKPHMFDLRISSISLLQDEKDKLIEKISISVPIGELDESEITELSALIKEHPGQTTLYFQVMDEDKNISLNFFAQDTHLNVSRELVEFLSGNERMTFTIN